MKQLCLFDELIVDNFAGGGGASTGIELATGRPVDIAINHDPNAILMHKTNHPYTRHYCESVWEVDPLLICGGRPVGLMWLSPDCKHFSRAKGGKPVDRNIRGLAWIAVKWAATVRPRVMILENVPEFVTWGPLTEDGHPDKKKQGRTFKSFVNALRRYGYKVSWTELRACDYGAPTIRKRFFLIVRCDGRQIVWPEATHGEGLLPYRTAADCIDWSVPCTSIFGRKTPLRPNTLRRIARGLDKFTIKSDSPFIIQYKYDNSPQVDHNAQLASSLIQYHSETSGSEVRGQSLHDPLMTVDASPRYGLMSAHITKYYSGDNYSKADDPLGTVTTRDRFGLVESHLCVLRNNQDCKPLTGPLPTECTSTGHFAEIRTHIEKYTPGTDLGNWEQIRTMLNDYCGYNLADDEILLLNIGGADRYIRDIGMRMLTPRELYNAQGFPPDYIIDHDHTGKEYSRAKQVARCGNAVSPPFAEALVRANLPELCGPEINSMEKLKEVIANA
ncbi:MAG: DNA cytosine methyltransferase [Ruminococcus sp.]|nr:DNA cytosine methyltransferase [Ruminococcus sp.]